MNSRVIFPIYIYELVVDQCLSFDSYSTIIPLLKNKFCGGQHEFKRQEDLFSKWLV